jgi:DNA-directed RNA polymerase subunit RPC12/RpoP
MGVDFRCENCGKLLTGIEVEPGSSIKCPHCHKKVAVPAGLASLPHPQVPANNGFAARPSAPAYTASGAPVVAQEAVEEVHYTPAMMGVMAGFMPWLISIFFHVGLLMITLFVVMVAGLPRAGGDDLSKMYDPNYDPNYTDIIIPDAQWSDRPGGVPNPGYGGQTTAIKQSHTPTEDKGWALQAGPGMSITVGDTGGRAIDVIGGMGTGGGGQGGTLAPYGLGSPGGSGAGPRSSFFGSGGNAHHVVYVIDRSGSMAVENVFDPVCMELLNSISKLRNFQGFHVILFASGQPVENPPKKIVPALPDNKKACAEFLSAVKAEGQTDPVPAMNRAFDAFAQNELPGKGRLIYLLTDGVFPDNDAVVKAIAQRNTKKDVYINTFLYGHKPPEAESVMRKIAEENGGQYRYVGGSD